MHWRVDKISPLILEQYLNDIDAEGYEAKRFIPPTTSLVVVSREKEVVKPIVEPVETKKKRGLLGWLQKNKG